MLVSIVIPAYNAERTLENCIEACLAQTYPDTEVIVVDDGSTDRTPLIGQAFASVRYVHQENRGPAAARNRGAREAHGPLIAFTDSDCIPREDWIDHLAARFEENVAAVGGTYGIANPQRLLPRLIHAEIVARHARFGEKVDFLGSFNVAYQREAFEAVGGFDEAFREASAEDNDLAYRLLDAGRVLRFTPDAVVNHYHPNALWPYLRNQARHGLWRVKLYRKHPGRVRGDQYAGRFEFLAPPASLVLIALMPGVVWNLLAGTHGLVMAAAYAAALATFYLLHVPMAIRLMRRAGRKEILCFAGLAALRDIARALGLLRGLGRFYGRKKEPI